MEKESLYPSLSNAQTTTETGTLTTADALAPHHTLGLGHDDHHPPSLSSSQPPPSITTVSLSPPRTYNNYTEVFLSEKYLKLKMFKPMMTEDDRKAYNQIQAVTRFVQEGCLVRAMVMGSGGGVLGLLFGTFFFTMKPVNVDTSLPLRQQIRQSYSGFGTEVTKSVKGFAKLGFIYSMFECGIAKVRPLHVRCMFGLISSSFKCGTAKLDGFVNKGNTSLKLEF